MTAPRLSDEEIDAAESDLLQYGHIDQYAADLIAEVRELRALLGDALHGVHWIEARIPDDVTYDARGVARLKLRLQTALAARSKP